MSLLLRQAAARALLFAGVLAAASDQLFKLQPKARTTVANTLWGNDAFHGMPELNPGKRITIGFWNSTGGGRVTSMHLVLEGPDRGELQRHVALSVTYDGRPYPSVFVPVGDFFGDQMDSKSANYANVLFAKRPTNSWWCYATMPYAKSILIELVSAASTSKPVKGYNYVLHDSIAFDPASDSYFHAQYASHPLVHFPWQAVSFVDAEGPGQLVGLQMVFTTNDSSKFSGNFNHVCEGNYEFFLDNKTVLYGNDSSIDYQKAGYQTSEHVIAVLGSEDMYGYSFGWSGVQQDERTGTLSWTDGKANGSRVLQTFRILDKSPIRFTDHLWAQVNWMYDFGHNVPRDLCPPDVGCAISYDVMSYLYLQKPQDASAQVAELPWPYPLKPRPRADGASQV